MNKFLRYFILAGLFAVPAIPLIVSSGMFFPFITGKNFAFRIIIELILAAWAILAVRDPDYRPKKSVILYAFAAFVAVVAIADVFGENFYRSFWSNYERMEGLIALLHFFAYFAVLTSVVSTEKLWRRFFYTSFGVNIAIAVFSFFQLAGKLVINQGGSRVDATLGNATYLAVYLLFQIFLAAFFFARPLGEGSDRDKAIFPVVGLAAASVVAVYTLGLSGFYYPLALIAVAVLGYPLYVVFRLYGGKIFLSLLIIADLFLLYKTETRGAILGLIAGAGLTLLIFAVGKRDDKKIRNMAVGTLAGLIVLVGLFIFLRDSSFIKNNSTLNRFASISLTEQTTKSRFMVWDMSWQGFKERPALGWGQDNFIVVFAKYYNPNMWGQEPWFDRSHNVFFDWLIAGGLLGLLSYLGLFGAGIYSLWRRSTFSFAGRSILTGLLAGYFFQNLFVFDNLISYILFFSVLGFIAVSAETEESAAGKKENLRGQKQETLLSQSGSYVAVPVAIAALAFVFYFADVKPIKASAGIIQALSSQSEGPVKNIEYFNKVFALNTFGSGEAREQLIQIALQVRNANAPDEVKRQLYILAVDQMRKQIDRAPSDVRYYLYLGSLLDAYGANDEAVKYLSKAVEISPKKQMVLFELALANINKGDTATALTYLRQAYEAAPEYPDAQFMLATGLIYDGRIDEADAFMKEKFGTVLLPDSRILSAYAYKHLYDRMISIRKIQLANNPNDQQAKLSLAAAYMLAGDRGNAIAVLQQMIKQDSAFKEQGEKYIEEIRRSQ